MQSIQEYLEKNFFSGYKILSVSDDEDGVLHIELQPSSPGVCQNCHSINTSVHDYYPRQIKKLPILGRPTVVDIRVRRVICNTCGHKGIELIKWLAKTKYAHTTQRKQDEIIKDCQKDTLKDVAKRHNLHPSTVKDIHKEYLQSTEAGTFRLGNTTIIGVDEFSIARHHTYATVVVDLQTSRVLYVGKDRKVSTLNKFFKLCGKEGCKQIKAVAMDQNASFELSVKARCPNAVVVYDLFHIIAKYGLTVISQLRTKLANEYKDKGDRKSYYDMKSSRWILLGNNCNLNESAKEKLNRVLSWNKPLEIAYMLKEQIRDLFFCDSVEEASKRWEQWSALALASEVPEIVKFAQVQENKYKDGIINSSKYKIGTSIVEGINNKIKVIKRKAYVFTDFDYFALLIKSAFPGNPVYFEKPRTFV